MFRFSKLLFLVTILCTVFACSSQKPKQSFTNPEWEIKGKLGVKRSLFSSGSANFQWQQQGKNYIIHVFNPLGQVQFSLSGNDQKAIYAHSDGTIVMDKNAEALLQRFNHWSLPIDDTSAWIHGKLTGHEQAIIHDKQQRISAFTLGPWHVSWRYKNNVTRPYRIRMQSDDVRITLIIKDYALFH